MIYGFWNNKGGTGKTSLCFQSLTTYAHQHGDEQVLAVDVCPQANLSELLLGGLVGEGGDNLLDVQDSSPRSTIGGYFQERLSSPYSFPDISPIDYVIEADRFNDYIPNNVDLLCGDPMVELQSNSITTLANTQVPGTNTWLNVVDWLSDFIENIESEYDTIFVDANPSFSLYTQIAISLCDRLVLPVMADDSSRRALQNAFSLIYGLRLPSEIYTKHAFATRLKDEGRSLPEVHSVVKNRLTQYMGPASAYDAVLSSINQEVDDLVDSNPEMFTFDDIRDGIVEIRDFQTTGVVAFSYGAPFYQLSSGRFDVAGREVQVKREYLDNCIDAINNLVGRLNY